MNPFLTRLYTQQFPMSEYVKDPNSPEGWKTICYDKGEERRDLSADSINLNADAMDEDSDGGNSDPEMEE